MFRVEFKELLSRVREIGVRVSVRVKVRFRLGVHDRKVRTPVLSMALCVSVRVRSKGYGC